MPGALASRGMGDEVHIREQPLPGIGRRFDLDIETSKTLVVVARRDGSRDVGVDDRDAGGAVRSVNLRREEAVAVGSLLLGARFSGEAEPDDGRAIDVGTVLLGPRSPAIGKRPAEVAVPAGGDVAVVAVARDDTPRLLEDDRDRPCQSGDRLVIAARRDELDHAVAYLAG